MSTLLYLKKRADEKEIMHTNMRWLQSRQHNKSYFIKFGFV